MCDKHTGFTSNSLMEKEHTNNTLEMKRKLLLLFFSLYYYFSPCGLPPWFFFIYKDIKWLFTFQKLSISNFCFHYQVFMSFSLLIIIKKFDKTSLIKQSVAIITIKSICVFHVVGFVPSKGASRTAACWEPAEPHFTSDAIPIFQIGISAKTDIDPISACYKWYIQLDINNQ